MGKSIILIILSYIYIASSSFGQYNSNHQLLNSIILVNECLETTNVNFGKKIDGTYAGFEKAYITNPDKTKEYYDKANLAKRYTNIMVNYINSLKIQLISQTEGVSIDYAKNINYKDMKNIDNFNSSSNFFINQTISSGSNRSEELKNKILDYKNRMLELVDKRYWAFINIVLNVEREYVDNEGNNISWQSYYFEHTNAIAAITVLNTIVAEALNLEFNIINQLFSHVDNDFPFDKIEVKVVPVSNHVKLGSAYQAEIYIVAFSSKSSIIGVVNGKNIEGQNGKIIYNTTTSSLGVKNYSGIIKVRTAFGIKEYPFKSKYTVE